VVPGGGDGQGVIAALMPSSQHALVGDQDEPDAGRRERSIIQEKAAIGYNLEFPEIGYRTDKKKTP